MPLAPASRAFFAPAAGVGHHDAGGPGLQGLLSALHRHDALEDEGHLDVLDDLPQLGHRLGPGGGREPLQEGQPGGVDVHGEHLGAGGLGRVQLGVQGVLVPGLHGGAALAARGPDGGGGGGEHIRVGAVAGEGGDARLDAGGDQNVVVLQIVVLVPVVEIHRPHGTGEHGQGIGLAEEPERGVHRLVLADGVHVQINVLPGLIVADGHGAGALGAGAGDGVPAGQAVAHRTGLAAGAAAGACGGQNFLIGHKNPSLLLRKHCSQNGEERQEGSLSSSQASRSSKTSRWLTSWNISWRPPG